MRRTTRLYYGALLVLAWQALATGCGRSAPLTFSDFVDDPIAREGTLARCNNDRAATRGDRECTEARRAAAAVAAQRQTARSEELARESERKRAAVRARAAAEERAHREARAEAEAAAAAAYDASGVRSRKPLRRLLGRRPPAAPSRGRERIPLRRPSGRTSRVPRTLCPTLPCPRSSGRPTRSRSTRGHRSKARRRGLRRPDVACISHQAVAAPSATLWQHGQIESRRSPFVEE
jgi:hypothetical protein